MNPPLEVVRRQDGTMGDIYGRPVIVVFDSNPNHATRHKLLFDNANEREGTQNGTQHLEFVDVSEPADENTAARTLIRAHVMRDFMRRRKHQKARARNLRTTEPTKGAAKASSQESDSVFKTSSLPPQPHGSLDPFARACRECRPQRVRCSLEQPDCVRCLRNGVQCSGPRSGPIFIRRDSTNTQSKSDRELLLLAIRDQSNNTSGQRQGPERTAYSNAPPVGQPLLPSTWPCLSYSQEIYRSIVGDFWVAACGPSNNSTRRGIQATMSSAAELIVPLAFRNRSLATAVFAVSAMYLGRLKGDAKLRELAIASYPTALSRFRSELVHYFDSKTEKRQKDAVMATVQTLLLFEWLANGPDGEGFRRHLEGALDILKIFGVQNLQSSVARQVYTALRSVALSEALRSRKTMFLAADYWDSIPYQSSAKTSRELLLDIIAHIPGLLERADKIKQPESTEGDSTNNQGRINSCDIHIARCSQAVEYLQDCDSLIQKLNNWLESLQESEEGSLWWYSEVSALTANRQSSDLQLLNPESSNKVHQLSLINFSSPRIPALLLNYWSGLLELSAAILEVRDLFHHDQLYPTYYELSVVISPYLVIDADLPTKLALRICHTAMHLCSTLEGCTMAYVPIKLAQNHFTRLFSSAYQRHWVDDSDRLQNCERARIGFECSKKAFEMLQSKLQNYH